MKPMPPGLPSEAKIDVTSLRNLTHERNALRAERDELRANIEATLYAIEPNRGDLSANQRKALDNLRAVLAKYPKE